MEWRCSASVECFFPFESPKNCAMQRYFVTFRRIPTVINAKTRYSLDKQKTEDENNNKTPKHQNRWSNSFSERVRVTKTMRRNNSFNNVISHTKMYKNRFEGARWMCAAEKLNWIKMSFELI